MVLLLIGAVLCLLPSTEALLRLKRQEQEFRTMDKSGDNKVSRAEFNSYLEGVFRQTYGRSTQINSEVRGVMDNLWRAADTNRDGFLNRQEYDDWNP